MRVVAGYLGGRRLLGPTTDGTRPTTDLVREAIFNSLASVVDLEDLEVIDYFAGTGAMGIEALSRGAKRATFVERDRKAIDVLRSNLEALDLIEETRIVRGDVMTHVQSLRADVVFADPPYEFSGWTDILNHVDARIVVCESNEQIPQHKDWTLLKAKVYGSTLVTFLSSDQAPTFQEAP